MNFLKFPLELGQKFPKWMIEIIKELKPDEVEFNPETKSVIVRYKKEF